MNFKMEKRITIWCNDNDSMNSQSYAISSINNENEYMLFHYEPYECGICLDQMLALLKFMGIENPFIIYDENFEDKLRNRKDKNEVEWRKLI